MRIVLTKTGLLLGIAMLLSGGELLAQNMAAISGNWEEAAANSGGDIVPVQYVQGPAPVGPPDYASMAGQAAAGQPVMAPQDISLAPQGFGPPADGVPPPGYGAMPGSLPTVPPTLDPWTAPYADHCPLIGVYGFSSFDSWRDFANGSGSNNNGVTNGFNLGAPLPWLSEYGFGAQLGASYGAYNFSGRRPDAAGSNEIEQQWFITGGFYRRADFDRRISIGAVFDLMLNDNFGVFNAPPTLGQTRFQLGYALGYFNELGIWGTVEAFSDTVAIFPIPPNALYTSAYFKPVNMLNLYWHHKWGLGGADSTLFAGVPRQTALTDPIFGRNFGTVTAGGSLNVPLTDSFALYANMMYMQPSVKTGSTPLKETWNISVGVAFYPGRAARSSTVAGRSSMPLLSVANNGSFLVNTNRTR